MNITYLNTWVGKKPEEYESFLLEKAKTEDVFCLQEVVAFHKQGFTDFGLMLHQWTLTENILKNFVGFHAVRQRDWYDYEAYLGVGDQVDYGNAIFVRKDIPILEYREKFILGHQNSGKEEIIQKTIPVVIQAVKVKKDASHLWIVNFHDYYAGKGYGKFDTEERITQSQEIAKFIQELSGEIILGGDFNINPDTQSLKIIESIPLENLISKYNIQTTRTSLYPKEKRDVWPHADYVFVNNEVNVVDFKVDVDSDVSDHAPMFLKIK